MTHLALVLAIAGLTVMSINHRADAFAPSTRIPTTSSSLSSRVSTFTTAPSSHHSHHAIHRHSIRLNSSRVTFADIEKKELDEISIFDPLGCSDGWEDIDCCKSSFTTTKSKTASIKDVAAPILALSTLVLNPDDSFAAAKLSEGAFNPDSFRPVCATSDGFYRFLQGSTRAVVGDENFSEYGPLIAGGLLRIRLELCVVESFFNEAVGPFIKENGLSWILPLHETVETFLAGTIFALATTFILVGSTKLVQVIAFYGDLVIGGPCRLLGGFFFDRALGEPVTLDVSFFGFFKTRLVGPPVDFKEEEIRKALEAGDKMKLPDFDKVKPTDVPLLTVSGGVKVVGEASKIFREFIEALDLFVGRYLVIIAAGYIMLKFVHFKVFPDFP